MTEVKLRAVRPDVLKNRPIFAKMARKVANTLARVALLLRTTLVTTDSIIYLILANAEDTNDPQKLPKPFKRCPSGKVLNKSSHIAYSGNFQHTAIRHLNLF